MKKQKPVKYKVDISWSDEDECYIARVPELPGCTTDGKTAPEALKNAFEAIAVFLEAMEEEGKKIPAAIASKTFSGEMLLRIEPDLHRDLAIKASIEGESLNHYLKKNLRKLA